MKNKITNVTNKLVLTISLLSLGICPAQEFEFTDLFPQKEGVSCYRIPSIVTAPMAILSPLSMKEFHPVPTSETIII